MLIFVDASIFAEPGGSVGHVSGELEFADFPRAGELLSLSAKGVPPLVVPGYAGIIRVRNVLHVVGGGASTTQLELEDITLGSVESAKSLMSYLEQGFGLFATYYTNGVI